MISFFVPGKAVAQGRISHFNGRGVYTNSAELKPWRGLIGWKAREAKVPLLGKEVAVLIDLDFVIERPKSVKREYPTVPSDLDKLIRSVLDSLTGIAYVDDSQVVEIGASKSYGETPGVKISISYL